MSRKHYIQVAAAISRVLAENIGADGEAAVRALADDMCAIFRADNDRFDRGRFLAACGLR